MRAGECVARELKVIEFRVKPRVHCVARFAGSWKTGRNVVQYRRLEVGLVAGITGCGKTCELPCGRVLVAVVALKQRMRPNEWEPVLMIVNLSQRCLPSFYRVAAFAVGAKLAPVDICVTVCAASAHIFKNQAYVAFGAGNFCVHAAQRITGLIVIEFRIRANGFPTRVGVTLLARYRNWPMRISDLGLRAADFGVRIVRRLLRRCARKKGE